jgi:hypothetical protein
LSIYVSTVKKGCRYQVNEVDKEKTKQVCGVLLVVQLWQ